MLSKRNEKDYPKIWESHSVMEGKRYSQERHTGTLLDGAKILHWAFGG